MRTSSPDHLYLSVGHRPLASLQLVYTLIGRYRIIRRSTHAAIIDNTIYPPHLLKHPTIGTCDIALRPSTDPYYEVELIQSTTLTYRTLSNRIAPGVEKRCFRIREGRWSVWSMEEMAPGGGFRVGVKLADLVLWEVPKPGLTERGVLQRVDLSSLMGEEQGWEGDGDGYGYADVVGNFQMTLWLGARACWLMKSQVGCWPGVAEVVHDEYWPMAT